jgi:hypothetical protein
VDIWPSIVASPSNKFPDVVAACVWTAALFVVSAIIYVLGLRIRAATARAQRPVRAPGDAVLPLAPPSSSQG